MKPGRELDALIAQRVMGIEIPRDADMQYLETCMTLPHYSTDIIAAWEVITHLTALSKTFKFELTKGYGDEWECTMSSTGATRNVISISGGESPSETICLAALIYVVREQ